MIENPKRYAVIDIGSNSARLLVCDVGPDGALTAVAKKLATTRLSEGLVGTGTLGDAAMERTLASLEALLREAEAAQAGQVFVFATAAVREAANRDTFIRMVHQKTAVLIDVLPGDIEAAIGFWGTLHSGARATIDIGGASTEIALGTGAELGFYASVKMGAVRALEKYPLGDIADALSLQAMQQWAYHILLSEAPHLPEQVRQLSPAVVSGVGGPITTLAAMDLKLEAYDPARIQGHVLTYNTVDRLINRLCELPLEKRRKLPGLPADRADIIIGGAVILQQVMRALDIHQITVSDRDNLEGYLRRKLQLHIHR
ncbi:MAG: Ppx/GppA phosphatase family protein [Eubacteriales bacterium]|nr:Ppx/GppA phosphatase family protein [Eubacteriales bacterium]